MIAIELKALDFAASAALSADALVLLVPPDFKASGAEAQTIAAAQKSGDLVVKTAATLALYKPEGFAAKRVWLVAVDKPSIKDLRAAVSHAMALARGAGAKRLAIGLNLIAELDEKRLHGAVLTAADAAYTYTHTKPKAETTTVQQVALIAAPGHGLEAAFKVAVATAAGAEIAKEWGNRPGNHATPTLLAKAAQDLAKKHKLGCEVLGPAQVKKLGMGSFMSVAQGSAEPLRFVVLRYNGAPAKQAPHVLVGKGITFDTGGISLKPGAEMDEMKFDMCGAASVLGAFAAIATLKPKLNVVGLIAACENMPDGLAVKPGDVVQSMSGQSIEILNTDAEGRLILCDALTYAERFKPQSVVDIATLTGACVIALGGVRSGMYASTDELASALSQAGDKALDPCWRMPLDDEYAEGLKSNFADVANIAGRAGGSITAAKFLQRFASKYPWGHLDIAGTAWKGGAAKGATGRPVGLLVQYLLSQVGAEAAAKAEPKAAAKTPVNAPAKAPTKAPSKTTAKAKPSAKPKA